MMKIIVDAFGGDNAPLEIIKGCRMAKDECGFQIILAGNEKKIKKICGENNLKIDDMEILDALDEISMEDEPGEILKSKNESSMAVGLKNLTNGMGDAFVSAGNSGALVTGATMITKRLEGVLRCAFAPIVPKGRGSFMLIDSGANSQCRPEMLRQFGIMGFIYMEKVMKIKNPRIGLANVGAEEHKGDLLRKESYKLLSESGINFIGNIEARDIPLDGADVIVADGFTGNIILKLYEGMASMLLGKFKEILSKNLKTKLAASLLLTDMKEMKKQIDYNQYGGAPLMGISKPVFKAHGSSTAITIKNAIRLTGDYIKENVTEKISVALEEIKKEKI